MSAPETASFRAIYLLAVFSAGVTTFVAMPVWRRWCFRTGLLDDPGHRKIHDQPIPLAGGLAVMTGLLVPILVAASLIAWQSGGLPLNALANNAAPLLRHGLNRRWFELGGILLGAIGMLLVGWLDDKHELRPQTKFLGQALIALLVAACGARITLFVPSPVFHYAITILWLLAVINAFNFMDNMNGLCAGLGAIAAGYFAGIAAGEGQYLVALIAFLTFGALLGFLPYNFPRARAFLGDAGSHLVGVLAVPLADMAWVVVLRWRLGRPFYVGDTNHLSHRLVRRGLSRAQAVLAIWVIAASLGALGLLIA
jgi:UDP-GlcNAc:undecaprenyl-phosphate/decaprenyl-phosphate GlcNAc-1-phosphate transferase